MTDAAVCEHEWVERELHVCPSVAYDGNQHAHYRWLACRKCGDTR